MSDYLFATPTFVSGLARTLDLAAQFDDYNGSLTAAQADWIALQSDAVAVYDDFWEAWEEAEAELPDEIR